MPLKLAVEMGLADTQHGTNYKASTAKDPTEINVRVKISLPFSLQEIRVLAVPRNSFWCRFPHSKYCLNMYMYMYIYTLKTGQPDPGL